MNKKISIWDTLNLFKILGMKPVIIIPINKDIFKLNLFNNFFNYSELLFELKEKKIITHKICKIKRIPNETE